MINKTKLIFLHVPKTGGTTLSSIIRKNYAEDKLYTLGGTRESMEEFKRLPREEINKYDCVQGHMGFGFHTYFRDNVHYISVLRQPDKRVVSLYAFILRTPGHYLHDRVTRSRMSFKEFVNSDITHELTNGQTRLIASETGLGITFDDKKTLDNSDLELAKSHLRKYFVAIGILERFDDFLLLLQGMLGWKDISYEKQNSGGANLSTEMIDDKDLRTIREKNEIDFELYDYARKLYEERRYEYEGYAYS